MQDLLKQGLIITFPLSSVQSVLLLEDVRQKALVYFSQEERQKRYNLLLESVKPFSTKLRSNVVESIPINDISISLLYDNHKDKLGVYFNVGVTSLFGISKGGYFNIESYDSLHFKLNEND